MNAAPAPSLPSSAPPAARRRPWLLVGGGVAVVAVLGGIAWGVDAGRWANEVIGALRAAGPVVFFAAMAVLPAVGFPLLPFALVAGPAFTPALGVGRVCACAVAAVSANTLLGYWLARRALRPVVERVLPRFGYAVPSLPAGTGWHAVLFVRLAPGLPFCVQSYVLGLLRVPLVPYLVLSTAIPAGYLVAAIAGLGALQQGRTKAALIALAVVGALAAGVQLWRRFSARPPAA
ncbi:MAG: hypothetical protein RLZZ15_3517 [Verrucomicrobiota bacterium]|jgi:uncharacterized membrane protein YdjX (TVP38/TMEM64 family)